MTGQDILGPEHKMRKVVNTINFEYEAGTFTTSKDKKVSGLLRMNSNQTKLLINWVN